MKKIYLTTLFCCLLAALQAQTIQTSSPVPEIVRLKELSFDFGKIPQGRPAFHVFEITNTGTEILKLDNVQTSCGCTTPEWTRDPIAPGASTSIRVGYSAASEGPFSKSITVTYNGNQTKTLLITGTVYRTPATSAPENASVSLLKLKNQ
ncbi:MAG TPA: DUF1573 domain-containing protein [Flavitalea sp.]|nr:DUF1573 domain-containing protein [Flavitalea sp.]